MDHSAEKPIFLFCLAVFLTAVAVHGGASFSAAQTEYPTELLKVGDRVPDMSFTDLAGNQYKWDWSTEGARLNLFFFWVPRSAPCILEMIYLDDIGRMYGKELKIVAVESTAMGSARLSEEMARYEKIYNYPVYPIVPDTASAITRNFGIHNMPLPITFFLDGDGYVLHCMRGSFTEETGVELRRIVEGRLKEETVSAKRGETEVAPTSEALEEIDLSMLAKSSRESLIKTKEKVPAFALKDMAQNVYNLNWPDPLHKLTIFFFWTPRSAPCFEEMLFLDRINNLTGEEKIRIFAVESSGMNAAGIEEVLRKYARLYTYPSIPILADPEALTSRLFGVQGQPLPISVLVDEKGSVVAVINGFNEEIRGRLAEETEIILRWPSGTMSR